jgi:signal transduction histidine kinase
MGLMMGGLLVSVAGAVRLSERRRARRQIRVLEQERAVAAERARIARDIHDELGSSLTKMSRLAETMEQQSGAQNQVVTLSKIMANTACDTIQTMDEIVWALNPKNDTLKEIANYLVFFTEDYLRPSGMVCSLDVTLNLPHIPVTAEVRHNIVMVVKEALNNAVKHARAQEIRFGLNYTDHTLTVEIADNGQGWGAPTLPVAGNGLTHMRKRMGAIGGRLDILREPGQGTTIKLEVPFPETKGGAQ